MGRPPTARLVGVFGAHKGEVVELAPVNTIGRDPTCTIVCRDVTASRRHAEISIVGGRWLVRDIGSCSGVRVNDVRVDRHALVDGEYLMVGHALWQFRSP